MKDGDLGHPMTRHDTTIRAMWHSHSIEDIARTVGKSRSYVTSRGRDMGLAPRSETYKTRRELATAASRHFTKMRPDAPRGMTPEQIEWAQANPGHKEAAMILGFAEGRA